MVSHVTSVVQFRYAHLRNISKIGCYLDADTTKSLVHEMVVSRLDYANSLIFGVSNTQTKKLQKLQNLAARITT